MADRRGWLDGESVATIADSVCGSPERVPGQTDRRTSRRTWSMLVDPGAPLQPLAASNDRDQSPPVLSHRGDAVAYLETVVGSGPPVLHRVQVRKATPASTAPEVEVDLGPLGPASYVLMDVAPRRHEIHETEDEDDDV